MQNNCSFLNEMQSTYAPESNPIDFCSLNTITPSTINYAMRLVNITGYTGQIQFPSDSRVRLSKRIFGCNLGYPFVIETEIFSFIKFQILSLI